MWARPLLCPDRASLTMWCDHGFMGDGSGAGGSRLCAFRARVGEGKMRWMTRFFFAKMFRSYLASARLETSSFPAFPILSSLRLKS